SEQRLRDVEQLADIGSCVMDLASGDLQLSAGMCHLLGEPPAPQPVSLQWLLDHVPEADHNVLHRIFAVDSQESIRKATHRLIRRDGDMRVVFHVAALDAATSSKAARVRSIVRDITDHQRAEQRSRRLAYFDSVTGLPNRQSLASRISERIARSGQDTNFSLA